MTVIQMNNSCVSMIGPPLANHLPMECLSFLLKTHMLRVHKRFVPLRNIRCTLEDRACDHVTFPQRLRMDLLRKDDEPSRQSCGCVDVWMC